MKILMVSTEYPPMLGGVGRYTANLVRELRKESVSVSVVCNEKGTGDFFGLDQSNKNNSKILLKIVNDIVPDIVHIQYEPWLYGLSLSLNPNKTYTYIDKFYEYCKIPIVTTFHSAYNYKQWMRLFIPDNKNKYTVIRKMCNLLKYWKHLINYKSFDKLNTSKSKKSSASIAFSNYLKNKVNGTDLVYHGAESIYSNFTKSEMRKKLSLPVENRLGLALGFETKTKGWDILEQMTFPQRWNLIVNTAKNFYNTERLSLNLNNNNNIINLNKGFLNDENFSLLFFAVDVVILPYTVASSSGVMFDAFGHGIPFIATDLQFFKEFEEKGLGITVKRNPSELYNALLQIDKNYDYYKKNIKYFQNEIKWNKVAKKHIQIYSKILRND